MTALTAIAKSTRPNLWLFIILNAVATGLVAGLDVLRAVLFALSLSLLASFGFLLNDIVDRRIDALIHPGRLALATEGTLRLAWAILAALVVGALTIAWFLATSATLIVIGIAICLGTYSLLLRKRLLIATLVCASCVTSPIWAPFIVGGTTIPAFQLAMVVVAFLVVSAREIVMDLIDVAGDRLDKRVTIATLMGKRVSQIGATILAATGIVGLAAVCILRGMTLPLLGVVAVGAGLAIFGWLAVWPTVQLALTEGDNKPVLDTFIRRTRYAMALLPLFIIVDWFARG